MISVKQVVNRGLLPHFYKSLPCLSLIRFLYGLFSLLFSNRAFSCMLYDRGLPLPLINAMDDRGRERKKANIVPLKRRVGFEARVGKRDRAKRHRSETEKSSFYRPVTSGADTEGSGRVS